MTRYPLAGIVGLALTFGATSAQAQPAHSLDAGFDRWDKNKDGFLDAEEMTEAFRGPNAMVIEDKLGATETHPDHQFILAWDVNKDGKLSESEFEKYELKAIADAKAAMNRNNTYTRENRSSYRSPQRYTRYPTRRYSTRGHGRVASTQGGDLPRPFLHPRGNHETNRLGGVGAGVGNRCGIRFRRESGRRPGR